MASCALLDACLKEREEATISSGKRKRKDHEKEIKENDRAQLDFTIEKPHTVAASRK
jgi:spore germination cell wall hydrolase CwlJ-like protein